METSLIFAEDLLHFIDASPTPFHAVSEIKKRLNAAGFEELKEQERWSFKGRKCYVVRGGTSIIAFILGAEALPCHSGFKIIGAHTDSPILKLKQNYAYNQSGYLQFGVEPYGGGIWRTWFDRDLYIAGRVILRKDGKLFSSLVELKDLVVSIPELAVHLHRDVNENGAINSQIDLPPVIALEASGNIDNFNQRLLREFGVPCAEIISSSLSLCSTESASLSGLNQEFIRSGQLDDLVSCHEAIESLINTEDPPTTCVVSLWDHEEIGSRSIQGADGPFLLNTLERIVEAATGMLRKGDFQRILARSFCISADMAHAVHPNHAEKHDSHHRCKIGGGPVIKWNANQHYATNDLSAAVFSDLCDLSGVAYQTFVARSDIPCGSTIGPIASSGLGVLTVDVGNPMLAMHSIREQCGVEDHFAMKKVFETFFSRGQAEIIET